MKPKFYMSGRQGIKPFQVGDLVVFKSVYQYGIAIIERFWEDGAVTLVGQNVKSRSGVVVASGNSITGPTEMIKWKV